MCKKPARQYNPKNTLSCASPLPCLPSVTKVSQGMDSEVSWVSAEARTSSGGPDPPPLVEAGQSKIAPGATGGGEGYKFIK